MTLHEQVVNLEQELQDLIKTLSTNEQFVLAPVSTIVSQDDEQSFHNLKSLKSDISNFKNMNESDRTSYFYEAIDGCRLSQLQKLVIPDCFYQVHPEYINDDFPFDDFEY